MTRKYTKETPDWAYFIGYVLSFFVTAFCLQVVVKFFFDMDMGFWTSAATVWVVSWVPRIMGRLK